MPRTVSACLCAVAIVVLSVSGLFLAAPVLAASGTVTMETPLHESPDPNAPLMALLPEGTVVSIDGPPVDGFYPVSTGGLSGWMRGETLILEKDLPTEEITWAPDDGGISPGDTSSIPAAQTADEGVPADAGVATDPATDPTLASDPADQPLTKDVAVAEPAQDAATVDPAMTDPAAETAVTEPIDGATGEPVVEVTDAAGTESTKSTDAVAAPVDAAPVDSAPVDAAPTDPAPAEPVTSEVTPAPDAAAPVDAPVETPVPTDANGNPVALVNPGPSGPAGAVVDVPIRSGPGSDYGLIFNVPAGSTIEQTGHLVDGWVSVQYKEVTGWADAGQLGDPSSFVPDQPLTDPAPTDAAPVETTPTDSPAPTATEAPTPVPTAAPPAETPPPTPIDVKTPRAGSGVAFTTVDMSLRSGPSADQAPIAAVPAGSRVVLTGVMEGNFQRVTFRDQVGWIDGSYLETPADPDPNGGGRNDNDNGNGNGNGGGREESYSRREIIHFIYDAADKYGQSRDDMLRVAQCESNLDPYAVNPSGSYGLFQFIRTTWRSTPYGDQDIFNPKANANAAAWMWSQGRKSEWVCQ